jgi:Transposase DDE domain
MELAEEVVACGSFRYAHRTRRGRWRVARLRYGCTRFTWQEAAYSLVVATGVCDESLILWTNEVVTTAEDAERAVRAYLRRWAVEDAHRVLKQAFSLEAIRVTGWRRVQRLVLLAGVAYGFLEAV